MDKQKFFNEYSRDLELFRPNLEGKYMCPICLRVFEREAIDNQHLTDGHVWPRGLAGIIDANSVRQHRVLLCKDCNDTAGSRGDAHIQMLEKIRESEETGELLGDQKVQVIVDPETEVAVRAKVRIDPKTKSANLTFPRNRNNPKDISEFKVVAGEDVEVSVLIRNEKPYLIHHAKVGWITAAYLFGFWVLGYRYILHPSLVLQPHL